MRGTLQFQARGQGQLSWLFKPQPANSLSTPCTLQCHCPHCFLSLGNFSDCRTSYIHLVPQKAKGAETASPIGPILWIQQLLREGKYYSQSYPAMWQSQILDTSPALKIKARDPHCSENMCTLGFWDSLRWSPPTCHRHHHHLVLPPSMLAQHVLSCLQHRRTVPLVPLLQVRKGLSCQSIPGSDLPRPMTASRSAVH